jgi:hypothetical protein
MARPAIVIGLGGTGQWILTFLKKDLLEIGKGEMPAGVKLLAFDTTKHASAVAGYESKIEKDPNDKRSKKAGAVELEDKVEYIHIGSNLNPLANEIKQKKHHHLDWFAATDFIRRLPEAALNADDGAGAIRHVGRLALIADVQSRANSKILSTIENAMTRIATDVGVTVENRLEILIVGSLAGGTGAGMLVDIPMLCRAAAAQKFKGNIIVRGFIVTPRTFVSGALGKGQDMLARSFAAWRELDRMLITSSEYGANQIKYSEKDPSLTITTGRRLYDSTYIIDPQRTKNPLDGLAPEEGVFPAIANAISAILDDSAGKAYSEQTINLSNTYFTLPLMPTHSAIGTYTMKVPVYYAQQKFTHELGKEILDVLLAPVKNDQHRVTSLSDTSNAEVGQDKIGINSVLDFLNSDNIKIGENPEIPLTGVSKLIAKVRFNNALDKDELVTQAARGGLCTRSSEWILGMLDVNQDEVGKVALPDINKEVTFQIWDKVKPSREEGDTPESGFTRVTKGVERERISHYGLEKNELGKRGSFGDELERAKAAQLRLFSSALRAWTDLTLNGSSVSPRASRGGKLGYVQAFYKNLIDVLTYFNGYIDAVNKKRSETLHVEETVTKAELAAYRDYNDLKTKGCMFTFWDDNVHPEAHRSQRRYLEAAQRHNNFRKDKILLAVYEETVNEMKRIVQSGLDNINAWVVHLATGEVRTQSDGKGGTVQTEIKSLYHAIQDELNNIAVNHNLDKSLDKVSEVVGEHTYKSDQSFIDDRLAHIRWQVARDENEITQADGKKVITVRGLKLALAVNDPKAKTLRNDSEKAIRDNLPAFVLFSEQPFNKLEQDHRFATEVAKGDLNTGEKLAKHLEGKSEPMYRETPTGTGPQHNPAKSALVRVHGNVNDDTQAYFYEFVRALGGLDTTVVVGSVDSSDPYKMTIVRFDDVIKSEDFDIYERCHEAYLNVASNQTKDIKPEDLHIFQPEINACKYETKIAETLKKNYNILHADVVALLEDEQRIEMFFRALALGFIKREDAAGGQHFWVYQLPKEAKIQLTEPKIGFGITNDQDYFRLINQFVVKGEDIRPGYSQANWINWEKLEKAIIEQHNQLGTAKVKSLYNRQATVKDSLIAEIRNYVESERAKVKDPKARQNVKQDHEDLANLAETIYKIAAEKGY